MSMTGTGDAKDSGIATDGAGELQATAMDSPVINTAVSGTAFLDDDTMATATATTLASSESIKAYADTKSVITLNTVVATTSSDDIILISTIPSGCARIEIIFDNVSQSTTDEMILQLGTSGPTWITSGYTSSAVLPSDAMAVTSQTNITGFLLTAADAAAANYSGIINLRLINGVWVSSGHIGSTDGTGAGQQLSAGRVTDPTNITHIRLSTTGAGTFDSGQVQVAYWA